LAPIQPRRHFYVVLWIVLPTGFLNHLFCTPKKLTTSSALALRCRAREVGVTIMSLELKEHKSEGDAGRTRTNDASVAPHLKESYCS
jgi:hypothetical protein